MRSILLSIGIVVMLLTVAEILFRSLFGLGSPPIYISDPDFEYIQAPNQNIVRFGNHITNNEYSMRSLPLSDTDDIRIIKIGDSVINGGAPTDQDSLATTILESKLSQNFKKNIRVLNVSAGSWGPDNMTAYLQKYGHFNASLVVMVLSSHDLYDVMTFDEIVGVHSAFPDKKPLLAMQEAVIRYLIPRLEKSIHSSTVEDSLEDLSINNKSDALNPGIQSMIDYSRSQGIPLLVYLHPEKQEVGAKAYDDRGTTIIEILKKNDVPYILGLENMTLSDYRDGIHLNARGQNNLAMKMYPYLEAHVDSMLSKD